VPAWPAAPNKDHGNDFSDSNDQNAALLLVPGVLEVAGGRTFGGVSRPATRARRERRSEVSQWRKSKWGDEISLEYGKSLRDYETASGTFRVFGSNGPIGWTTEPLASGPGVILGRKGAYRGVQFSRDPFFVIDTAYYVVPKTELDMRWLCYAIKHDKLGEIDDGSPIPSTTRAAVYVKDFEVPAITEQRAIAGVLGSLDDKIELNRRMNETLEALARSLFKSWFVETTQSALPNGWRYATIAELCEINSWTLGKGDDLDQIEYVEISEVMRGNIANIQSYERGEEPSRARRRLRQGDTVLSTVRPDRGAYFLCLNLLPNLIGSTGFVVLTPTKAPWSFIHAAMTQPDIFEYLGQQADGGACPAVRPEIIGGLEVPWPNKPELVEEYHRACAPLYECAESNRQESRTLAALRDALPPKLLSGEWRVPAAAGKLAEARA
jgi:type I restriction enzyme S subunit